MTIYYGWCVVLASFVIAVYVAGTLFFGFTAFFEPLVREFGWSYTEISLVVSLRGLEIGIFAPVAGFLADRYGSRRLIVTGTAIVGLGFVLLSLTQSLVMFYGAFFLLAFGAGGCTSVVLMTAVAQWFTKNIGKAFGIMACGYGAGGLMIPLIVWVIESWGWRTALVWAGLGMLALGIPLSWVIRDKPAHGSEAAARRNEASSASRSRESEPEGGFGGSLRDRNFWFLNLAEALRMMTLTAVTTHIMPYLSAVGMERHTAGIVAAAMPVVSIAGRFGFGWMADLYDKRRVMVAAYGLMAAGLLAFTQAHLMGLVLLFLILFSPGFGGTMIIRGVMLREYFGVGSFGKLLGITMGMASFGGMLGPPLAGWVFDTWGTFQPIWFAFCGLIGVSIVFVGMIRFR